MGLSPQRRKKVMKDHVKAGVVSGIVFGIFMAIFSVFTAGFASALLTGIIAGTLFGLIIGVFGGVMSRKMAGKLPLRPGEEIVREGSANHILRGESVGGWLTVTNQRLHFTSHKINIQTHNLSLSCMRSRARKPSRRRASFPTACSSKPRRDKTSVLLSTVGPNGCMR